MPVGSIAEDIGTEMDDKKKKRKKKGYKKISPVQPLPNPKPGDLKPIKKIPPMKKGKRNKMREL